MIELYDRSRFLTITGHVLGKPRVIAKRQTALMAIYRGVFGEPQPEIKIKPIDRSGPPIKLDQKLLTQMRKQPTATTLSVYSTVANRKISIAE